MTPPSLEQFLHAWKAGQHSDADLAQQLAALTPTTALVADALVDLDRAERCGAPEVVYGPGKTPSQISDIFLSQWQRGQDCLATRLTPDQAERLALDFQQAEINPIARTVMLRHDRQRAPQGTVAVITAGTGDRPIAEEAAETARWLGARVRLVLDIGVAGPRRLLENRKQFLDAQAIVVVAGMEGALPSVIAGWVRVPVFAVPTSVGYGASFQGLSALLTMINSCAANVAVVNIDAGFKAGYLAGLVARQGGELA